MSADGGPAFPRAGFHGPDAHENSEAGMSLRDYFAGQALVGLIAKYGNEGSGAGTICYELADAMLAARRSEG